MKGKDSGYRRRISSARATVRVLSSVTVTCLGKAEMLRGGGGGYFASGLFSQILYNLVTFYMVNFYLFLLFNSEFIYK